MRIRRAVGTLPIAIENQSIVSRSTTEVNDSKTNHGSNTNKTLLPGCGRPLNYIPKESDPDYSGQLFKNALSGKDIAQADIA